MKKRCLAILLALLFVLPVQALADFQLSMSTDGMVTDVIFMGDDNTILGTVMNQQTDGDQIIWTLNIATGEADSGYFYTKDATGNWIRGSYLGGLSALSGGSGSAGSPSAGSSGTAAASGKPWPVTTYTRHTISIRPLAEDKRVQSRCGPSTSYHGAGAYKTYKMTSTKALFVEGNFVLVELDYTTVGKRVIYFPVSSFYNVNGVPSETLSAVSAYTTASLIPAFGPGYAYDTFDEAEISSGTALSVFFEENGWVFAEFDSALGMVRAWIPIENVGY